MAPGVGFALLLMSVSLAQWIYFRSTLKSGEGSTGRVAYQALSRVLAQAHRMNDDLPQQEAIQGLARAPGILFACVLNADNKIVAHTQPAQLGKMFIRPNPSHAVVQGFALQEGGETWGRLVLGFSRRSTRTHLLKETLLLLGLNIGCGLFLIWGWKSYQGISQQHQKEQGLLVFHIDELEHELEQQQQSQAADQLQWGVWMKQALEQISRPALFLDSRQRLAACNPAAIQRLGLPAGEPPRGISWQDIPVLTVYGDLLQRAMDNPGQGFLCSRSGASVEFVSEKPPGGTWVFFR